MRQTGSIFFLNFSFFGFMLHQMGFLMFPVGEKFSSFLHVPSVYWHCKIDEVSTMVFFADLKNFYFLNLEWDTNLGRFRLVFWLPEKK